MRVAGGSLVSFTALCKDIFRIGECASKGNCVGRFLEGAIDVAGLETGKVEVIYAGWLGSSGDSRSKEEMLVIELPAIERAMEEA